MSLLCNGLTKQITSPSNRMLINTSRRCMLQRASIYKRSQNNLRLQMIHMMRTNLSWVSSQSKTPILRSESLVSSEQWQPYPNLRISKNKHMGNIRHHQSNTNTNPRSISITFKTAKDEHITVLAAKGENILQVAHRNSEEGVEIEGACEGVCACSTCHVILEDVVYDRLIDDGSEPSEDEEDMLDMAFGLTTTSRLGCQVEITEDMEGAVFEIPSATRNFYVDGHVPKPH